MKNIKVKLNCPTCGKEFYRWPCRIKAHKQCFCSRVCSMIGRHPSTEFKTGHIPKMKGKKTGFIPSNAFKKGNIPWNKGISITLNDVKGKTYEELYGLERAEEIKKKIGLKSIGRKANLGNHPSRESLMKMLSFRSPNKMETKLDEFLQDKYPGEWKFVGNGEIIIGHKNPDWINLKEKWLIELFGRHWHEEGEVTPRIDHFSNFGYKTLIIWDTALKDWDGVLQVINETFYKN